MPNLSTSLSALPDFGGVDDALLDVLQNLEPDTVRFLQTVAEAAPHLKSLIMRDRDRLDAILSGTLSQSLERAHQTLLSAVDAVDTEADMMAALRHHKQHSALAIALWDLGRACPQSDILQALTDCADVSVGAALRFLLRQPISAGKLLWQDKTVPSADQTTLDAWRDHLSFQGLGFTMLAMGKHGAGELNYSSDIDLIMLYDPQTTPLKEGEEPPVFWVRFVKCFVRLMQERTGDGYAYRVDLRLRPDPSSTPLAVSLPAALQYYESMGQNWERAALIKARPIAGDLEMGEGFLKEIVPFIWRKYLDYAAIEDIHSIKRQIHIHKGFGTVASAGQNVKLGRGGIREIEFFVQTQQLIAGGRTPVLRGRRTLDMLDKLAELDWIKPAARDDMAKAYDHLRAVENRIQMMMDEQTHIVPEDTERRRHLAILCGEADLATFDHSLISTFETVQRHYEHLFEGADSLSDTLGNLVFTGGDDDPATLETLEKLGFQQPANVIATIRGWHYGRIPATRAAHARAVLTQLVPTLVASFAETSDPDQAFAGFDRFVTGLPAGLQLFSLLKSNPQLLKLLSFLLGSAPKLANVITRRPHVLDALLDPSFFQARFDRAIFEEQLSNMCNQASNFEDVLDRARIVGQQQKLLIGVRLLTDTLTPDEAARAYSALADATISVLLRVTAADFAERHGTVDGAQIAVLGMGKLGSREMTASSDLDLIFLYDFDVKCDQSNGPKPLAVSQYFARLTQRLITALSAPTGEGTLYELDFRLRPSGNAGPLATQFSTFITYQKRDAWTWERMSLTRARAVAGDADFCDRVEDEIKALLKTAPTEALMSDASDMLGRIREAKPSRGIWDIKTMRGGLVDVEFAAQVLQLSHASIHDSILTPETSRVFAKAKQLQLLLPEDAEVLSEALKLYHTVQQLTRIGFDDQSESFLEADDFMELLCTRLHLPSQEHIELQLSETAKSVLAVTTKLGLVGSP